MGERERRRGREELLKVARVAGKLEEEASTTKLIHTYTPHTETHKRARVYFSSPFPLVFPSLFLPQLLRASTLRELFLIPLSLLLRCWIEKREREERERERVTSLLG